MSSQEVSLEKLVCKPQFDTVVDLVITKYMLIMRVSRGILQWPIWLHLALSFAKQCVLTFVLQHGLILLSMSYRSFSRWSESRAGLCLTAAL